MLNSILFLAAPLVSSILVAISIAVLDSKVGLHRLVIVGDVELLLSSIIIGFSVTALIMYIRRNAQLGANYMLNHVSDCSLLYVTLIIVVLYSVLNDFFTIGGMKSAYVLILVSNSVVTLFSHFAITKFMRNRDRNTVS